MGNAIDQLPPLLREVFILYFDQELSYREIAKQLGISYANVCKRISQARAILRKWLQEYVGEEDSTGCDVSGGLLVPPLPNEKKSGELEEVRVAAGGVPEDAALSVVESVPARVTALSEEGSEDVEPERLEWGDLGDESKALLCYPSPIPAQVSIWDQDEGLFSGRQTKFQELSPSINHRVRFQTTPSDSDPPQPPLKSGEHAVKVPLFKVDLGGSPCWKTDFSYRGKILPAVGRVSTLLLGVLTVRSHFIKYRRVWADSGGG